MGVLCGVCMCVYVHERGVSAYMGMFFSVGMCISVDICWCWSVCRGRLMVGY